MIHPGRHEAYFRDISRKPNAGDEFIELMWSESELKLQVTSGVKDDTRSYKTKPYTFATSEQLDQVVQRWRNVALRKGFKHYDQVAYILAEGKPRGGTYNDAMRNDASSRARKMAHGGV